MRLFLLYCQLLVWLMKCGSELPVPGGKRFSDSDRTQERHEGLT